MKTMRHKSQVIRVNDHLHEVVHSYDQKGKLIHTKLTPMHVEVHLRDLMQIIIGASILAVPVGFTEETWRLGSHLPWLNIILLSVLSLAFVSAFVFFDSYRHHIHKYGAEYLTRVLMTYGFAILVVGVILTIIDVAPWMTDWAVALKRVIIISFPATVSAAITDTIK